MMNIGIIINGIQKYIQQKGGGVIAFLLPQPQLHRKAHRLRHLLRPRYLKHHSGFVLEILSFGAILSIATGNPAKFALIYSMGNILTLAA